MKPENPYFTAYRNAHGLAQGDPWRGYQFMLWVQAQWREFEAEHGLTGQTRYYHRDQFDAWMRERWLTPAEYRAHVADQYPDTPKAKETLAIIEFIERRAA